MRRLDGWKMGKIEIMPNGVQEMEDLFQLTCNFVLGLENNVFSLPNNRRKIAQLFFVVMRRFRQQFKVF